MIRQVLVFCGIILSDVTSAFGPTQRVAQRPVHQFCLSDSLTPELNTKSEQYELHSGNRDSLTSTASTRREIVAFLGSMMAFSSVLCGHPTSASATYTASTSIYVSEEVKTLDLSLPSYDSINTLKSSAATERGLGVENPSLPEEKKVKTTSSRKAKNEKRDSGNGGNPLSAVLPSMNKSVAKKSTPKGSSNENTTARNEKEATNNSPFGGKDEIQTMDISLPSYVDGTKTKEKGMFAL